jgi:GNAT superfamily N-acetyltransferase
MPPTEHDALTVRPVAAEDRSAVIELCRASLGWGTDDPNEAFFSWKHDQNPFGTSPAWVAEADGRLVGLRVFLRWRFRRSDGSTFAAVRAVDTATHPDWQGKGIFTRLTTGALPDLTDAEVGCVFNTPNDKSRPGYLKMGWQVVGRVPVAVRVRSPLALRRVAGARAAAEKWSTATDVGVPAAAAFADRDAAERLLRSCTPPAGLATDRDVAYLQWRYSFEPLAYRVAPLGDRLEDGVIVFRLRRRGAALEATLSEVLAPTGSRVRSAVGRLLRETRADYAIRTGAPGALAAGFVPAAPLGPILTWRTLADPSVPALGDLSLALGDVELF